MVTWTGRPPPAPPRIGPLGWLRVGLRGGAILGILAICFPLSLILRLPERAIWGAARPVTPWITQGVCIAACAILGLHRRITGVPMRGAGAFVANHTSWLDIFVLNAGLRMYFVAKAEVAGWGGIGWLARGTGTIFVERKRGEARAQAEMIGERLRAGHRLLFFPEGTSTDGLRVLEFKTTLFAPFLAAGPGLLVQPLTVLYRAPEGREPEFYGWWGEMEFGPSLLAVLAQSPQGSVEVTYHPPLSAADFPDRKALARAAEAAVRSGFSAAAR